MQPGGVTVAWGPDDIPDLDGLVTVVTGANGGLGLETAMELAAKGAHVVMASRDQEKANQARRRIEERVPGASLETQPLDLAALASVRDCADAISETHPSVDILVNNAGVMAVPERRTADGFEMQFGVNHLGHFVLTRELMPALLRARRARIVTVTSFARITGRPVDPANPHMDGKYDTWRAYGRSKLANLHFAIELHRRLREAGATAESLAAQPGLANTDIQSRSVHESGGGLSQRFWDRVSDLVGMPPSQGALPQLRAATDPQAMSGELYGPLWGTFGDPVRRWQFTEFLDRDAPRVLWEVSERETGETFDLAELVREAG